MVEKMIDKLKDYTSDMMYPQIQIGIMNQEDVRKYSWNGNELLTSAKDSIYEIGSITKTFTAGILAKAIGEGKVKLDETIDKYISGLLDGYYYPTFTQLATHTGGYTNELKCVSEEDEIKFETRLSSVWNGDYIKDNLYGYLTNEDLLQNINGYRLQNKQYEFCYSNVGYAILGYTLGKVYNSTYDELLLHFIKDNLQLQDTYIGMNGIKDKARICKGYNKDNENCDNWNWDGSDFKAAGCIYSTLDDMLQYIKIYMNRKISYLNMTHDKVYATIIANGFNVGLAWIKSGDITWHNGGTGCFRSFAGFREDTKKGVVVLTNYKNKNEKMVDDIGFWILNHEF